MDKLSFTKEQIEARLRELDEKKARVRERAVLPIEKPEIQINEEEREPAVSTGPEAEPEIKPVPEEVASTNIDVGPLGSDEPAPEFLAREPELVETLPDAETAEKAPKSIDEKIRDIKRRLAQIDKELEIDSLETELEIEKSKLKKAYFRRNIERRISTIEKRIDQLENPFKWYIIAEDKLSEKNFEIMFGKSREDATLKDINEIYGGEAGKDFEKASRWTSANKFSEREHAVLFTSNGFYLKLENIKDLKSKNKKSGKITENRIASYAIIGPGYHKLNTPPLDYKEGKDLLLNMAERYQAEQLALFEFDSQNLEK